MLLLDSGSEVNSVDREGLTPLHQAVMHGNRDAVELLLAYGASVFNGPGVEGTRSALELAGHVHVCHRLVQDAVGESPLSPSHTHSCLLSASSHPHTLTLAF